MSGHAGCATIKGMLILTAILLGIVEGLTEFLPVSSTGHLILAGNVLNFTGAKADTFEVVIQLGAILAIVWLYRERFIRLLQFRRSSGLQGTRGIGLLLLTTLPALVVGFLTHDFIKDHLFQPLTVAIGLAVGGVILIVFERFQHHGTTISIDKISKRQALAVGLFQLCALWPGVSRSASTILGGMIQGLDRKTAVEYSFLIAVPVMIAASGFDLLKSLSDLSASDIPLFATGFIVAFVAALLAVKYFVQFVQRFGFTAFGWYRIALAALVLLVLR
jgi:undecaprenyl-diphosphatase